MGRGEAALEAVGVDPRFWSGRRVLVTGHTGFKGSWLALWLHSMGAETAGFSRSERRAPALYDVAGVGDSVELIGGDVRDADSVAAAVERARPEVVLHLAAQPLVRRSYAEPVETFETNVNGTVNLLEALRGSGDLQAVVVVTSDKCYLNRGARRAYREDDPLGGADPYSASKAAQEIVAAAYRQSFSVPLATARAGNVIGGGDFAEDRLVPDAVRAALEGRPVEVRNPHAVRPWQHVLNPLAGYLLLAQRLADDPPEQAAFNFGPDPADARPVGEIVARLAELWPRGLDHVDTSDPHAPHEAGYLHIDSSRAREILGWAPRWNLDEGLRASAEWYAAYGEGADMREVTLAQIREFAEELAPDGSR
jgi:CDP-glucose 4,6-dehydratase